MIPEKGGGSTVVTSMYFVKAKVNLAGLVPAMNAFGCAKASVSGHFKCVGKRPGEPQMGEVHDWDLLRDLYLKIERSELVEFDGEVVDLCRRVARDVAISQAEAEHALLTVPGMKTLMREMRRRISEGSRRLSRALVDSARCKEAGDLVGARAILEGLLSVEEVPLYREQAQIALDYVDEPEDE